jgi:hypothetical protein
VTVAVGAVSVAENEEGGAIAAFSSRGLAQSGVLKPDVVAAGVARPDLGAGARRRGESASAR